MRKLEEIKSKLFNVEMFSEETGQGFIVLENSGRCSVIFGMNEEGWEHVSVAPTRIYKTPTWDEMARIKSIFWNEDEDVLQIHPKADEYVNVRPNCLHLWKPKGIDIMETLSKEVKNDKR